jgi:hypothetical protein
MPRPKTRNRGFRDWSQLACSRKRAKHQLKLEPLCRICLDAGRITPATVADHIKPHDGCWNEFRLGALQSLCAACHSGPKRAQERGLTLRPKIAYGTDGWPITNSELANFSTSGSQV